MADHRIIATSEQIAAAQATRLNIIVLPLEPEAKKTAYGWSILWGGIERTWRDYEVPELSVYDAIGYQAGDRIFLDEPWYPVTSQSTGEIVEYWTDSCFDGMSKVEFDKSLPSWVTTVEGNDAKDMPKKAAKYWFSVESVQIKQMVEIDRFLREKAGLPKGFFRFAKKWDAAFPDFPCLGDRWVIVLQIASIATPETSNLSSATT